MFTLYLWNIRTIYAQIAKFGWPTIDRWLSTWSALCRHIYRPLVGSANRHAVATTVGTRLAQQRCRHTNCWPIAWPVCLPNNGPTFLISPISVGICIGPLLRAQSGPQSMQRSANGWPINVIVDLTAVGQSHATQHCAYLLQLWAIWLPLVVITEYKLKMYIIIIKLCLIVVV